MDRPPMGRPPMHNEPGHPAWVHPGAMATASREAARITPRYPGPSYPGPSDYKKGKKDKMGFIPSLLILIGSTVLVLVIFELVLDVVVPSIQALTPVHKVGFYPSSSWEGQEYQYSYPSVGGENPTTMHLTVDSIKKGTFSGTVRWPDLSDPVTKAVGTIVTKVSGTRWNYVLQAQETALQLTVCSKGIYLTFTETAYLQGDFTKVGLNAKYYGVVCDNMISGVWFYPDKPNDEPGGEFSLQEQ